MSLCVWQALGQAQQYFRPTPCRHTQLLESELKRREAVIARKVRFCLVPTNDVLRVAPEHVVRWADDCASIQVHVDEARALAFERESHEAKLKELEREREQGQRQPDALQQAIQNTTADGAMEMLMDGGIADSAKDPLQPMVPMGRLNYRGLAGASSDPTSQC